MEKNETNGKRRKERKNIATAHHENARKYWFIISYNLSKKESKTSSNTSTSVIVQMLIFYLCSSTYRTFKSYNKSSFDKVQDCGNGKCG